MIDSSFARARPSVVSSVVSAGDSHILKASECTLAREGVRGDDQSVCARRGDPDSIPGDSRTERIRIHQLQMATTLEIPNLAGSHVVGSHMPDP